MERKPDNTGPDTPEVPPALAAAGIAVMGGALLWLNADAILRSAPAGYATARPYTTAVDLTPAGWIALGILALGLLAVAAAAALAWMLYDGNRTGWARRAVPVVPPEAVQTAAGCAATATILIVTLMTDLPAWMGLPVALLGGAALGWAARDAATPAIVRALAMDALDRTLGFPAPGQARIRRLKIAAGSGRVTAIAVTTGPNFQTPVDLHSAEDRVATVPQLAALTWRHDHRRRILIGEVA